VSSVVACRGQALSTHKAFLACLTLGDGRGPDIQWKMRQSLWADRLRSLGSDHWINKEGILIRHEEHCKVESPWLEFRTGGGATDLNSCHSSSTAPMNFFLDIRSVVEVIVR